jgi:hypothetical protein
MRMGSKLFLRVLEITSFLLEVMRLVWKSELKRPIKQQVALLTNTVSLFPLLECGDLGEKGRKRDRSKLRQ